jgi:hypothetical protein
VNAGAIMEGKPLNVEDSTKHVRSTTLTRRNSPNMVNKGPIDRKIKAINTPNTVLTDPLSQVNI